MKTNLLVTALAFAGLAGTMSAQSFYRHVNITGRGDGDRDRCLVDVIVDGAAQVEIRGDDGNLTNISGQAPQWRRLECTAPMPPNPVDFRFRPIQGRGQMQVVGLAREGAPAVIRIDDPEGGAAGYTFELTWRMGPRFGRGFQSFREEGPVGQISPGISACQRAVEDRLRADGYDRVRIPSIHAEDRPGGGDRVSGYAEAQKPPRGPEQFDFSCSVNLQRGEVRSLDMNPRY